MISQETKPISIDIHGNPIMVSTMYQDFINAQKEFEPARKDSVNPHFRSKYAQLSSCIDAVKPALNNNNFAFTQNHHDYDGGVAVETIIYHISGGSIRSGVLKMPASKQDPQGYAGALTYARRNNILTFMGIAPEDDDGNKATGSFKKEEMKNPVKTFEDKKKVVFDRLKVLGCDPGRVLTFLGDKRLSEVDEDDVNKLIQIGKLISSGEISHEEAFVFPLDSVIDNSEVQPSPGKMADDLRSNAWN